MSRVKPENFITIQGWMVKMGMKGNELLVYAIIYGFSQAEEQCFKGSLRYLADWTNSTKQGVTKNLKSLVDKGYIVKRDIYINGVKYCEYRAVITDKVPEKVNKKIVNPGLYKEVVGYLNERLGTSYKHTTKKTQDCINARLSEGFTVDDFRKVIDIKVAEWLGNSKMERYLRPETLFGNKFEGYLNTKPRGMLDSSMDDLDKYF